MVLKTGKIQAKKKKTNPKITGRSGTECRVGQGACQGLNTPLWGTGETN